MIDKCHLCGNVHESVMTPFPEDGIRCPYDPTGKSLYPMKQANGHCENVCDYTGEAHDYTIRGHRIARKNRNV